MSKPTKKPNTAHDDVRTDCNGRTDRACRCAEVKSANARAEALQKEAYAIVVDRTTGKLRPGSRGKMIAELARIDGADPEGFWDKKSDFFLASVYQASAWREARKRLHERYPDVADAEARRDLPLAIDNLRDARRALRHYAAGHAYQEAKYEHRDHDRADEIERECERADASDVDEPTLSGSTDAERLTDARRQLRNARRQLRHRKAVASIERADGHDERARIVTESDRLDRTGFDERLEVKERK
jgi:hypothetical protein